MASIRTRKEINPFICSNPLCGRGAGVGWVIKQKVYCAKCGEIIKGLRDKNGKRVSPPDAPA